MTRWMPSGVVPLGLLVGTVLLSTVGCCNFPRPFAGWRRCCCECPVYEGEILAEGEYFGEVVGPMPGQMMSIAHHGGPMMGGYPSGPAMTVSDGLILPDGMSTPPPAQTPPPSGSTGRPKLSPAPNAGETPAGLLITLSASDATAKTGDDVVFLVQVTNQGRANLDRLKLRFLTGPRMKITKVEPTDSATVQGGLAYFRELQDVPPSTTVYRVHCQVLPGGEAFSLVTIEATGPMLTDGPLRRQVRLQFSD